MALFSQKSHTVLAVCIIQVYSVELAPHSPTGGAVVHSQTDREVVEYRVRAGAYTGHSDRGETRIPSSLANRCAFISSR